MELVRGLHNLRPRHRGCAATIGNFDGVHLGHQSVLGQLAERATELQVPVTVVMFEPQPREYFAPETAPPRLTRFREKVEALRRFGVDRIVCVRFDHRLADMAPEAFVRQILLDGLGVKYLVVGDDFRFGRDRAGTFSLLEQAGDEHGFPVVNMHTFGIEGSRVSSTRIREALAAGAGQERVARVGEPGPDLAVPGCKYFIRHDACGNDGINVGDIVDARTRFFGDRRRARNDLLTGEYAAALVQVAADGIDGFLQPVHH
mgnify:CR=1 FL=1